MRKLRCAAKSAIDAVKHLPRRIDNRINYRRRNLSAAGEILGARNRALNHSRLLKHLFLFVAISRGDGKQHALETRPPITIGGREVGATIKWFAIGSEKRSKWPSPLACKRRYRDLIAAVNIRTLVAIDLHCYVMLIHNRRHFWIVIGLAIHHVTPVAPNRANVQEHGLVRRLGRVESLLAEFVPLDGLVHCGAQVGGGGAGEGVLRKAMHS